MSQLTKKHARQRMLRKMNRELSKAFPNCLVVIDTEHGVHDIAEERGDAWTMERWSVRFLTIEDDTNKHQFRTWTWLGEDDGFVELADHIYSNISNISNK